MDIPEELWTDALEFLIKTVGAFLLSIPIAWEREKSTRIMGLRTFPIVAMASCGFVFLSLKVVGADSEPQARILQGLMTGIGFIGGGAILKGSNGVKGTATAASIWATGILGAAAAHGRFEIAVLISLATFLTLNLLTPIERRIEKEDP